MRHVHIMIEEKPELEPYGGRFAIFAVSCTRRESMGSRRTRQEAEAEARVYEKYAAMERETNPKCKFCVRGYTLCAK